MFYYKKLKALRFQEYTFQFPNKAVGEHYMFLEDVNDIVNVLDMPYQRRDEPVHDNMTVTVRGTPTITINDYNLFKELQKFLQFKTIIRLPHNHSQEGDIFLGYADVLILPITSVSSTVTLHPTFQYYDKIWVQDLPYTGSKTFFLDSFDPKLWLTFIGLFALCLVLSLCISKLLRSFKKSRIETFNVVSLILDQGVEHVSSIWSHRILLFSLGILLIIFFCGFGAFLSSLLAIKNIALPFDDLKSVFTQNEYTLCAQQRSAIYAMAEFDKKHNKHFMLNINTEDCPGSLKSNLNDILEYFSDIDCELAKVIFITPGNGLQFREFANRCNISPLPGKYLRQDTSFLLNPGFKHRKVLNRMLIRLRTTGVIRNEFVRIQNLAESLVPLKNSQDELQSITFYQIHLIMVIFLIGATLSLIILAIEILYKRIYS